MSNTHILNETYLRVAGFIDDSIVDGPGIRFTIFTQGCPHHCPGCHNPQTHSFDGGKLYSIAEILSMIDHNPLLYGVTFSGGEPFCQPKELLLLAEEIKKRHLHLAIYSGFYYDQLCAMGQTTPEISQLLQLSDWLIDGPFVETEKDLTLDFRGSRNQHILKPH